MSSFPFHFSPWVVVKVVTHVACWTRFFGQTPAMWHGFPQYKQRLFTHRHCFSYSVNGLNRVLSIFMGSSLGAYTICLGCNMGGVNCLNVGDNCQRFYCWCSKSQLSQHTAYAIVGLKVVGSCTVNKRSFMFPRNPNWNWFMSIASYQEMSHVSCSNSKAYTKVRRVPWQRAHNLFVALCSLFELPKKNTKSFKKCFKVF